MSSTIAMSASCASRTTTPSLFGTLASTTTWNPLQHAFGSLFVRPPAIRAPQERLTARYTDVCQQVIIKLTQLLHLADRRSRRASQIPHQLEPETMDLHDRIQGPMPASRCGSASCHSLRMASDPI